MQNSIKRIACLWAAALLASGAQAQEAGVDFQASTLGVLAALGVQAPATEVVASEDLIAIIGAAMADGKSDDYINALVLEAHSEGKIVVPDSMTDEAGEVDSAAMLAAVVGAAIAAQPAQEAGEIIILEAAAISDDLTITSGRTHTVKSGDTLLAIAQNYYGSSGAYRRIMEANPNVSNANLISIGMVLNIPG